MTYWRQKETLHQKCCIPSYRNIILVRKCGLSWILDVFHIMTYWTFGSVFMIFLVWADHLQGCTVRSGHKRFFAMKFRKSLWKLFYKQELIKLLKRASGRNNDIDERTFAILKYGRNEQNDVLRFYCSRTT